MPAPIIAAIITAATAATTTGLELAGVGQPSQPKPAPAVPAGPTAQQTDATRTAISQQLPNLQAATGGSLSPEYFLQLGQLFSGTANTPGAAGAGQQAVNQFFGIGGTGSGPSTNPIANSPVTSPGTGSPNTFATTGPSLTTGGTGGQSSGLVNDLINQIMQSQGALA